MINTGINSSLLKPQTFHVLTFLKAGRNLAPLPQRLLLVGVAKGTATPNVIVPVDDPSTTDAAFLQGSPLALMCRKAFATAAQLGQGPALFACPLAETTTAQTETLTLTGAATADDNLVVRIAGRTFSIGIANGTTAANAATPTNAAFQAAAQDLPYTSAVAGAVVTLTGTTKGVFQNDTIFDVVHIPTGLTAVWAQGVAGVGAVDIQPALDAMAGQQFDGCAISTHIAADVVKINATIATRFSAAEKKPCWFFIGEPGSIATATALGANHEGIVVVSWEQSRSLPGEIATAAAVAALSKSRPNANYDGLVIPLYPPPIAYDYTNGEIETALNAGLTPMSDVLDPNTSNVIDGQGKIVRLITTRTTLNLQPFGLLRDLGVSRTAWYMARQYDIAYAAKFGGNSDPDGVLDDDDVQGRVRDMIVNLNKAAEDQKILKNVDTDIQRLLIEDDPITDGRLNVDVPYTIVVGLHQIAYVHRAQVGG